MLDHFDGSFQANERKWKILPNAMEDRALNDKTGFYSESVRKLIGLEGIQKIHNIFEIGRNVKQVFQGSNPFKVGFGVIQHFASIPENLEINHSTFPYILKNYPFIFCRGSYRTESFGSDSLGFNAKYFPDVVGKKMEYCRDYLLYTLDDTDDNGISHLKSYEDETFLNHFLGEKK